MNSTHVEMTIKDLVELDAQEALQVDAEYQRGAEWSVKQERLLVDSLLRGYSIPLFYFHKQTRTSGWANNTFYYIIDGQQRKNAITRYVKNQYSMFDPLKDSRTGLAHFHKNEQVAWGGLSFDSLPAELRNKFLETQLQVVMVETTNHNEIRDLFIRLQAGLPLSAQEKRDAWPGDFTRVILELGGKESGKEKWRGHEFFRRVLKGTSARGNRRKLCASMFMQFYSRRENRYNPDSFTAVNAKDIDNFYQYQVDFDASSDASHAPRFRELLDEATRLLGDGKRPKLEAHMAYNVILFLDLIMGNFAPSWKNKFVKAFDKFQSRLSAARKSKDPSNEYWIRYGMVTGVSAASKGSAEQRYRFFELRMMEDMNPLSRLDAQRAYFPAERELVFYRDRKICQLCEKSVDWNEVEIDHIVPHAVGGETSLENARLVHRHCHARGPRALDGFREEDAGEDQASKPWEEEEEENNPDRTQVGLLGVAERQVSTEVLANSGMLPDGCTFVYQTNTKTISARFNTPHTFLYKDDSGAKTFDSFKALLLATIGGRGKIWANTTVQMPGGKTVRLKALRDEYIASAFEEEEDGDD